MAKTIYVLNGPNLNLLGTREPEIYGRATLKDVEKLCREAGKRHKLDDRVPPVEPRRRADRLDPGGRRQEGRRHRDQSGRLHPLPRSRSATRSRRVKIPVIEVHISNIFAREDFRHHSRISRRSRRRRLSGFGIAGYALAIDGLAAISARKAEGLSRGARARKTTDDEGRKPASITTLIRELAELLDETGLTEIEFERDGLRVRVARQAQAAVAAPLRADALAAPQPAPHRSAAPAIRPSIPASSPRRWSAPPISAPSRARGPSSRSAARCAPARRC